MLLVQNRADRYHRQLLYSRILLIKETAQQQKGDAEVSSERSTLDAAEKTESTAHGYEIFLDLCERLFDNEMEAPVFEDRVRGIFGNQVSSDIVLSTTCGY